MEYYTYAYLREDGTPYYIGKGKKDRWSQKQRHNVKVPPKNRVILLKQNISEEEAFKHEKYMIFLFGRKDLKTGILRNKTDGGEGCSGYKHSEESKLKISKSNKGRKWSDNSKIKFSQKLKGKKPPTISEEAKKRLSVTRKGVPRPKDVVEKIVSTKKERYNPENHPTSKKFVFISPTGEKYEVFGRFKEFCNENGLSNWGMRNFMKTGKIVPGCKNWRVKRYD
jgi:hypothetical protein